MLQTAVSSVLDGNFIVVDAGEVLVKPAPTEVVVVLRGSWRVLGEIFLCTIPLN